MSTEDTTTLKAARAQLLALVALLRVSEQCQRLDGDGLAFVAGTRGIVRPVDGGELTLILRKPAPDLVKQMLGTGLIQLTSTGDMTLARMPEPREFSLVREALGLHKAGTV
jgi:hypothetical protein